MTDIVTRSLNQMTTWHKLRIAIKQVLTSILNRRNRDRTIRALSALGDPLLKDIGLHRSEIKSIAAELMGETELSRTRAVRSAAAIKGANVIEMK